MRTPPWPSMPRTLAQASTSATAAVPYYAYGPSPVDPRTGEKSLLADIVGLIATGKPNCAIPQADDEAREGGHEVDRVRERGAQAEAAVN